MTVLRALSIRQPWASLIALGHKHVETRSWRTNFRGRIAIHAAKSFHPRDREFAAEERALGRLGARIPLAAVVATATLARVIPTELCVGDVSGLERHLGNFSPGRFAWFLEDVEALDEPVPASGRLGLWTWRPK